MIVIITDDNRSGEAKREQTGGDGHPLSTVLRMLWGCMVVVLGMLVVLITEGDVLYEMSGQPQNGAHNGDGDGGKDDINNNTANDRRRGDRGHGGVWTAAAVMPVYVAVDITMSSRR
eukprot:gb/GECH01004426.1/.p1 GENE.gb/GECH01004426.1/~~gb/GECH01004426.1/.p1  ORF type:complete len:117 (+),score=14.21 gb/GECH01004426.1/:1-351(+)